MISALFGLAGLAVGLPAVEAAQELGEGRHLVVAVTLREHCVDAGHVHLEKSFTDQTDAADLSLSTPSKTAA